VLTGVALRDLSLHLLDIITNSVAAGATRISVGISVPPEKDELEIRIDDNGKGMAPDFLKTVTDPFSTTRTTRKVGLGIPLFKEACELTGGSFEISSEQGVGTSVTAKFVLSSIDRIPLGDVGETISGLIGSYPDRDFVILFSNRQGDKTVFDTYDIRERLQGVPLSDPDVYLFIRDYLKEQQEQILGGI
jgi:anti-sigma regulatory factor (Ser/Thr protein kinase)